LGEHVASIFEVEEAKQDVSVKESGNPSHRLAGNFGLYRKKERVVPQFPLARRGTE
jgi:hypothetical protein